MKIFGKDFLFNNKKIYHEGNKPVANDILFNDGQTFQQKLENGSLKGPQGSKGDIGPQGPAGKDGQQGPAGPRGEQGLKGETGSQGPIGPTGAQGVKGNDGFTWRPSIDGSGNLTWTKDSSSTEPSQTNIKGPKGDVGATGPKGEQGATGSPGAKGDMGPQGPRGTDGFTWRPSVNSSGELSWTKDSSSSTPSSTNIKGPKGDTGATGATGPTGPQGPKGADGLTTSVTVNGQKYSHSGGNITLPNFLKEDGGNMTGSINNNLITGTYLDGNKGKALLNSTCAAGSFTTIIKSNSTNGYFTLNTYNNNLLLAYTAKDSVTSSKNELTHRITLMNEQGNTEFPNALKAKEFIGPNTIKIARGDLSLKTISSSQTCDYVRLSNNYIACDNNKKIHFIDDGGNAASIYASSIYNDGGITVNHKKTTTYFAIDLIRKCESNNASGYTHSTARLGCTNTWGGAASLEYRENDTTKNQIEVHDGFVRMNGKAVFIQSGTPSISTGSTTIAIPTGAVWIQV